MPVVENLRNSSVNKMATREIVVENELNGQSQAVEAECTLSHEDIDGFNPISEAESNFADEEVRMLNFPVNEPPPPRAFYPPVPTPGQWNSDFNSYVLSLYGGFPYMCYQPTQPYAPMMNQWYVPQGYEYGNQNPNYYNAYPYCAPNNGPLYYGQASSAFAPPQQNAPYCSPEYQNGVPHYPHLSSGPGHSFQPYSNMTYPTPPGTVSDESEVGFASNSGSSSPVSAEPHPLSPGAAYRASLNAEAPEFVPRFSVPQYPSAVTYEMHPNMAPSLQAGMERMPAQDPYRQGMGTTSTGLNCNGAPVSNDRYCPPLGNLYYDNLTRVEDRSGGMHSNKTHKIYGEATCAFCYRKGGRNYYHPLKDSNGEVLCPFLRLIRCFLCGATGAFAHTSRYCPKNPSKKGKPTGGATGTSSSRKGNPSGDS